ncbi:RGF1 INDUCIBLE TRANSCRIPTION FACTOR 1-like protein [Drosera capensis]
MTINYYFPRSLISCCLVGLLGTGIIRIRVIGRIGAAFLVSSSPTVELLSPVRGRRGRKQVKNDRAWRHCTQILKVEDIHVQVKGLHKKVQCITLRRIRWHGCMHEIGPSLSKLNIQSVPTLHFFAKGKRADEVRRYVYHDVVRLIDLQKLIDCSYIQPYTINGAKVIFLNERAQARSYKGANACFTCERILQHSFSFCSLSCKVDHMLREERDLSRILYRIQQSDFAYTQFEGEEASEDMDDDDDAQITDSSMVDLQGEMEANDDELMDDPLLDFKPSLACSSHCHHEAISTLPGTSAVSNGDDNEMPMKQKKKKKGRRGFMSGIVLSLNSCRRKGAPQRSPLS